MAEDVGELSKWVFNGNDQICVSKTSHKVIVCALRIFTYLVQNHSRLFMPSAYHASKRLNYLSVWYC